MYVTTYQAHTLCKVNNRFNIQPLNINMFSNCVNWEHLVKWLYLSIWLAGTSVSVWGLHWILTKLWDDTTAQVTPRERQSGRCLTTILPVSNWALDVGSASCVMFCLQIDVNRRKRNGKWRRFQYAVSHWFNIYIYINVQPLGITNFRLLVNMTFLFLDYLFIFNCNWVDTRWQ
jgi:hypothetical protein